MITRNSQRGSHHIILIIGAVILLTGVLGWTFFQAVSSRSNQSNAATTNKSADLQVGELENLADLDSIRADAVTGKKNITITHLQLTESDGILVYKIQLSDGMEITYDANSGAKLKTEIESDDSDSDDNLPSDITTGIGFAKALEIAKNEIPGSMVSKIEFKVEEGVLVYSVRFTDKARVDINAESGNIVRTKAPRVDKTSGNHESTRPENDDDESREAKSGSHKSNSELNERSSNGSSGSHDDNIDNSGSGSHHDEENDDDNEDDNDEDNDNDEDEDGNS